MSYDLFFYGETGKEFAHGLARSYFKKQTGFRLREHSEGFQAWYENEATGVYCSFEFGHSTEQESAPRPVPGFFYTGICFNLNYIRPTFFAMESMPLVQSFMDSFELFVGDPQDQEEAIAPVKLRAEALISSWQKHNAWAVRAAHEDRAEDLPYLYCPLEKAVHWWRYTREKDVFQEQLEDDVFVPSIYLARKAGEPEVQSLVIWSDALPQVFPKADFVLLNRMAKDEAGELYSKKKELLPWQWVLDEIGSLAQPCEGPVNDLVVTPSDRSSKLSKIFGRIEGASLEGYEFLSSDGFVDVPLEGKLRKRPP